MFTSSNQQALRQTYLQVWQKHQEKKILIPLEQQILQVILLHPEYHFIFDKAENILEKQYHASDGETNPFLHMGLHLGLREQLSTSRPAGIVDIYKKLCNNMSAHDAEHHMMQCLAETLYQAQKNNRAPDELEYLVLLKNL